TSFSRDWSSDVCSSDLPGPGAGFLPESRHCALIVRGSGRRGENISLPSDCHKRRCKPGRDWPEFASSMSLATTEEPTIPGLFDLIPCQGEGLRPGSRSGRIEERPESRFHLFRLIADYALHDLDRDNLGFVLGAIGNDIGMIGDVARDMAFCNCFF